MLREQSQYFEKMVAPTANDIQPVASLQSRLRGVTSKSCRLYFRFLLGVSYIDKIVLGFERRFLAGQFAFVPGFPTLSGFHDRLPRC
jgi:hypothetical protein